MNTKMSLEQMVEYMKNDNSNVPDWLLDIDRLKSGAELSRDEMLEYAECFCSQARSVEALTYLIECEKRFGLATNGGHIFVHGNVIMQIDKHVIEVLLQCQIDAVILERRPADRYISVMRFYLGNRQQREQEGSTWMTDFIDEVLISGSQFLISGEMPPAKQSH
ncbi:hypothetical protein I6H07_09955 [Hafnia alvei]|uniref:hypothetical protein n=1 Tax=Hafnia alvei TaxID=569 RepID=UPI000B67F759|nr:hypothetical protein [Hafnia alvei]MBI0275689.1 hypothetical protein [Hafnia alvei]MBI0276142.1 hypothetical protein [Hafnia alvei]PNK93093.1 hypothetical protein CEQ28_023390 [Hafnia alvei]PNK98326.1 hypothetical protein CEQ28_012415 [Hafnia alvei]